jgi:hypothetical protein
LTTIWTDGNFLKQLIPHLVIFKPTAFPEVFSWTTYGIGCFIETLVKHFRSESVTDQDDAVPQYYLELVALAERLLAFGYTGSARVLVKDIMQPFWTTLALAANTTPMINPRIVGTTSGSSMIKLWAHRWPLRNSDDLPARASSTALEHTYSAQLAHVSDNIHWVATLWLLRSSNLPWIAPIAYL